MRRSASFAALTLPLFLPAMPVEAKALLLISVDALRPDYVTQADTLGIKVPNLRRFMTEGSYARGVTGVAPTITCPSHASLVTGVTPALHGVTGNDPVTATGFVSALCTFASDIKTDTLWDAAARAGIVTGSVAWPNTMAAAGVTYNIPHIEPYVSAVTVRYQEALSQPAGLLPDLEAKLGSYYQDGDEAGSEIRTRFAAEILRRHKPGFMLVHIIAVDHAAHAHGPLSDEAKRAVEHEDAMVGRLAEAALAVDPETVIAVVSDHGQAPVTRSFNPNVALVAAGLVTLAPQVPGQAVRIADWKAKIWSGAGSFGILLRDPADEATRAQVAALLHRLAADPANGIGRVIESAREIEALGGYPGAAFVVGMKAGTGVGGHLLGEQVVAWPATQGVHGYLPDVTEMNSSFFIRGKGIAAGRDLGIVDMLRIAPTLAGVMGTTLKDAAQAPLPVSAGGGQGKK